MSEAKKITELAGSENDNHCSSTFVIEGEGHTLGNVLKNIVGSYNDVEFCGYTIPHPTENKLHFRIQTSGRVKAIDALRRGLDDLKFVCDTVLENPL